MQLCLSDLAAAEWDHLVSAHGGALQQGWRYGEAVGRGVLRAEIRSDGERRGLVQIVSRKSPFLGRIALISRGPVWLGARPDGRLPGFGAILGRGLVMCTPEAGDIASGLALMTPAHAAELDLTPPLAALRAGLRQKWRNRLVRAEAAGLSVTQSRALDWLLAREAENRAIHRYRGLPEAFLRAYCADRTAWRMIAARRGGRILAAGLFLVHGTRATYQIGWSGAEGRRLGAQTLVLWNAACRLSDEGVTAIDLGSVDTVRSPGLARFKLGTGARLVRLGPTGATLSLRSGIRSDPTAPGASGAFPHPPSMR